MTLTSPRYEQEGRIPVTSCSLRLPLTKRNVKHLRCGANTKGALGHICPAELFRSSGAGRETTTEDSSLSWSGDQKPSWVERPPLRLIKQGPTAERFQLFSKCSYIVYRLCSYFFLTYFIHKNCAFVNNHVIIVLNL